jgi:hypothetical protein
MEEKIDLLVVRGHLEQLLFVDDGCPKSLGHMFVITDDDWLGNIFHGQSSAFRHLNSPSAGQQAQSPGFRSGQFDAFSHR